MGIRQYASWAEHKIACCVVDEGLRCGLLGMVQGPLTLTYMVRLVQPSPGALRRLLGMGPALAQALQCATVRVSMGEGAVLIEVPLPATARRTPTARELARHTHGLMVAVGLDALRRPVRVDLRHHGAVFWVGPSRRGKTQSMKSTLYALAREHLYYAIVAQKLVDWAVFDNVVGCLGVVNNPHEALSVLRWATSLLQRRAARGTPGVPVVVVVDDLLNLLAAEPSIADPLGEISSMGAGLGVHLLAGTQEAGSKRGTGGAAVENNATARIVYRSSSAAAGARAGGQGGLALEALSSAKGDALLVVDGESVRIATGRIEDSLIAQLPAADAKMRAPWAATSGQPAQPVDNRLQPVVDSPVSHVHDEMVGGDVVQPVVFPIPKRAPTEDEAREIWALRAEGLSLNSLCRVVYGHKDGRAYDWIKAALDKQGAG